jgi:hypothetical protein
MTSEQRDVRHLIARLDRVESRARWIRWIAIGVVVAAALAIVGGAIAQPKKQIVTADEFRLVDISGNIRARLTISGETAHGPALLLYGLDGQVAARLHPHSLEFSDSDGVLRLALLMAGGGELPIVALFDENGEVRVDIGSRDANRGIRVNDAKGRKIFARP